MVPSKQQASDIFHEMVSLEQAILIRNCRMSTGPWLLGRRNCFVRESQVGLTVVTSKMSNGIEDPINFLSTCQSHESRDLE
ncbi:hypothetical protein TNIN_305921 [Trichonephila inaurata madagascariensis]|uniref:Uncharacterized protein n=1 Tax=Trichonephila inaurata madagascariensis TaxID=2747483 RepID=A0A8X6WW22_9ARAC|nr:hypothetical protein TNIN_305921 [Trichonephila inaurata madagascariensis]